MFLKAPKPTTTQKAARRLGTAPCQGYETGAFAQEGKTVVQDAGIHHSHQEPSLRRKNEAPVRQSRSVGFGLRNRGRSDPVKVITGSLFNRTAPAHNTQSKERSSRHRRAREAEGLVGHHPGGVKREGRRSGVTGVRGECHSDIQRWCALLICGRDRGPLVRCPDGSVRPPSAHLGRRWDPDGSVLQSGAAFWEPVFVFSLPRCCQRPPLPHDPNPITHLRRDPGPAGTDTRYLLQESEIFDPHRLTGSPQSLCRLVQGRFSVNHVLHVLAHRLSHALPAPRTGNGGSPRRGS
ncbi:hypothetical protein AAFF_G00147070 [Aldrovandia affinis]|uniref:Uncharacterized protein n=1 Tax=Aldrovandia affinis TaxID=143900 RepID=A0AAD7RPR6_9TELE|nr:hypothetical protein AAFF_G00147070 [Aldrovandia affinis]